MLVLDIYSALRVLYPDSEFSLSPILWNVEMRDRPQNTATRENAFGPQIIPEASQREKEMILVSARSTSHVTVRDRPQAPTVTAIHCHTAKRVQSQVQRPRTSSTKVPQCPHRPTHRPHHPTSPPHSPTPHPRHFAIRRNPKVITTRHQPRFRRTSRKISPGKLVTTPGNSMRRGSPRCSPPTVQVQQIPS